MSIREALGVISAARIIIVRGDVILDRFSGEGAQETAALHYDSEKVVGLRVSRGEMLIELA